MDTDRVEEERLQLLDLDQELLQEAFLSGGFRSGDLALLALVCRRFRDATKSEYFRKRLVYGEVFTLSHDDARAKREKMFEGMKVEQLALGNQESIALLDDKRVVHVKEEEQVGTGAHAELRKVARIVALPPQVSVVMVRAGYHHFMLIDSLGQVFSWGSGLRGALGHGGTEKVLSPKKIETLSGHVAVDCSASRHSFVVTDKGDLFAFGCNNTGQLGLGDGFFADHECVPTKASVGGHKIKRAVAGYNHSVIITADGLVYTCGRNTDGRLGLGQSMVNQNVVTPTRVDALSSERIVDAAATITSTLFLTDQGTVFSCGSNHLGQLGLGIQDLSWSTPAKVVIEKAVRVVEISCGFTAAWLLTSDEQLFFCGNLGEAGMGMSSIRPLLVKALGNLPIRKVVSGYRRTSLLL